VRPSPIVPLGAAEDLTDAEPAGSGIVAGFRHAGPIAVAGLVANAANVVVTVVVARLLTSRGYGELAQLNGVFLFLSMPGSALLVGVVRRAAALRSAGRDDAVRRFAKRLHALSLGGVAVITLVALVLSRQVAHALRLDGAGAVIAIVAAAGFWLALSVDRGLLQARRDYKPLAVNLLVEGGMRMAYVLVLTAAGLGVTGACVGVLLGEATAAAHARFESRRRWAKDPSAISQPEAELEAGPEAGAESVEMASSQGAGSRKHLATDVLTALGCLAFLALLQNLDVILLGRESPKNSGAYAAISVAAKALVFGAIALGAYLLPEATIRWHRGQHALRQLATTAAILAVPVFGLLIVSLAAPKLLLRAAFGQRLVGASGSFSTLVLAMAFLCATVLLTNYLLGAGRRWIVAVLGAGTIAAAVVFYRAHGNPATTARADLVVQGLVTVVVAVGFLYAHKEVGRRPRLESVLARGRRGSGATRP
jgi:O-antigen/teichoic acid export membrane protein